MVAQQRKADGPEARERLLQVAEHLFMAQGFAAVSTRQICAAAGVTQPTMYHHFGSKEHLYLAVVLRWFAWLRQGIEQAIAMGHNLVEQLHGIALIFWTGAVGEYQAMQRDAMAHMPPEHQHVLGQAVRDTVVNPLIAVMQAAVVAGDLPSHADPVVLTQLFWAVIDGISGLYRRGDAMPSPVGNRSTIQFFLAGACGLTRQDYLAWPAMGAVDELFRPQADAAHLSSQDQPHQQATTPHE